VSSQRTVNGVMRQQDKRTTAALIIDPAYTAPELAAAAGRARGLSVQNPSNKLRNLRTVVLTQYALSSMPTVQCVVLTVVGEKTAPAEFRVMLAKVFPDATLLVRPVTTRSEVPEQLLSLHDHLFGND
jgi:hypothetical protein